MLNYSSSNYFQTVILLLAVMGLSACSQSAPREQQAVPSRDGVVVAESGVIASAPARSDDARITTSNAASNTGEARVAAAGATSGPATSERDVAGAAAGAVMNSADASGPLAGAMRASGGGAFLQAADVPAHGEDRMQHDADSGPWKSRFASERADPLFDPAHHVGMAAGSEDSLLLAQAGGEDKDKDKEKEKAKTGGADCARFARQAEPDMGEMLRAGCQPSTAQMSALMDNPLGNVAMLFTQFDLYRMENPLNGKSANKGNYMGIAQFPKAINKDWNLINRVVWNVPSMPLEQGKIDRAADRAQRLIGSGNEGAVLPPSIGAGAPIDIFDGRTTSFGDMYYNGLFAPKKGIDMGTGKFLWGAGFNVGIPTATEDILGTGKWLAGPSALGVYMGKKWKIGALVQHYWDVAGDDDRDDVNLTNLQYFIFYSLDETTSIGAAPNILANWEQDSSNAFTIPIGLGISKTIQFGKVPVRFGVEFHYSVVKPDDLVGSEWDFRFYMIPAAPSALFEWMTKPLFGG